MPSLLLCLLFQILQGGLQSPLPQMLLPQPLGLEASVWSRFIQLHIPHFAQHHLIWSFLDFPTKIALASGWMYTWEAQLQTAKGRGKCLQSFLFDLKILVLYWNVLNLVSSSKTDALGDAQRLSSSAVGPLAHLHIAQVEKSSLGFSLLCSLQALWEWNAAQPNLSLPGGSSVNHCYLHFLPLWLVSSWRGEGPVTHRPSAL